LEAFGNPESVRKMSVRGDEMKLKTRIQRLEQRTFSQPNGPPPIAYFDRLLNGTVTEQDRQRWTPWLQEHLLDKGVKSKDVEPLERPEKEASRELSVDVIGSPE
jgi:hypothetical protein